MSPIPLAIVYAGLAGTLIALLIGTGANKWSPRVFFLLALRLAIGWHFMFEGFHKIHSYYTGPTDTNRPFSSEPYFKVAPGPIGERMRKNFGDPAAEIAAKVKAPKDISKTDFAKLSLEEQAAACPDVVAKQFDMVKEEQDQAALTAAKAAYARWVYGVDVRATQVKFISGEVMMSAPERIEHLAWINKEANLADERRAPGLGHGNGTDAKRVAEYRISAFTAEADLARDANTFIAELKKDLSGGKAVEETPEPTRGQTLDLITMWFLVVVGACLMGGLFTRLACLLAAGFLVMTYLAHPAFPWYPLPPNTEGNPVFINKNMIEALALCVLACYPTGRWLGLDALVLRPFCKYKAESTSQL